MSRKLAFWKFPGELAIERTQLFSRVNVGPGYEGDLRSGSENSGGPVISLELPIFDQNQAQIAKERRVPCKTNEKDTSCSRNESP